MNRTLQEIIRKILPFILFIGILFFVFTRVTYLFREVSISRDNITGFSDEGEMDVVCIGASTMVEYYQPLTAWEKYGFTSYAYATIYGQFDLYWRYIDKVLETHNPELFVIDIRMITAMDEEVNESGLRFWTDSLPMLSLTRYASLNDYLDVHSLEEKTDTMSYYIDIAKYHTNTLALSSPENWKYIDNKRGSKYKGHELSSVHHFFEEPVVNTEEMAELSQMQSKALYHLLDYCKEKDLNALFVVCPYIVKEEEQKVYNTVKGIVESYGYNYINANEYYEEMDFDFTTDIKNVNHVNCIGAEKYTVFLGNYITNTYEIPTHRGDDSYSQWDADSQAFSEALRASKEEIYQTIKDKYAAAELAESIKKTEDLYEWLSWAKNPNYSLVVCASMKDGSFGDIKIADKQCLEDCGIDVNKKVNCLRISSGEEIIFTEESEESISYSGWLGELDGMPLVICEVNMEDEIELNVGGREVLFSGDGIHLILVDNNFKEVIDCVGIDENTDGTINMIRMKNK